MPRVDILTELNSVIQTNNVLTSAVSDFVQEMG